ncbi:hypothetical protein GOP47_0009558 [Adiantum capillus-veneris]|uniref:tRNA (Cytosine(38)-C(5))-methyltransferase n=1 Tax=Adiantum capillus-veneris TaxID=13818 RepID=A0A9D4UXB6_ADICA|nr:hypothetical protein GOP47_0009558 [Adiantum capillus-veneris]
MANDVYEYNFGHRPNQGNIQHLTIKKLDGYDADAWLLSPPCQPYTRQGLQKDADDLRASSFLKLLEILPLLCKPPAFLFIENVVGFESSVSHDILVEALKKAEFSIQEFILTPLQLGIPYSRPRYFCLAKRRPFCFSYPQFNNQLLDNLGPAAPTFSVSVSQTLDSSPHTNHSLELPTGNFSHDYPCKAVKEYLEDQLFDEGGLDDSPCMETHSANIDGKKLEHNTFEVPGYLIDRWGDVFDVVTPNSRRCCCFTKSYGRFVKGTGSFIATKLTNEHGLEQLSSEGDSGGIMKSNLCLKQLGLRYFTPREIANLHSFPKNFGFPDRITIKQRYALLGNSLSVAVVASLLRYLFRNN